MLSIIFLIVYILIGIVTCKLTWQHQDYICRAWYFKVDPDLDSISNDIEGKKLALLFGIFWPLFILIFLWHLFVKLAGKLLTKVTYLLTRLL